MRGLTDEQVLTVRKAAIRNVREMYPLVDIEIIVTFFNDFDGNAIQFLGKSIMKLGEADLAVFLPGWESARGCRIEHTVAVEYEIERLYIE